MVRMDRRRNYPLVDAEACRDGLLRVVEQCYSSQALEQPTEDGWVSGERLHVEWKTYGS